MRLLDNAIAVGGGEAERRRRTGRWAATSRGTRADGWKWEAEMPRAEIRVDHSSRVRRLGFVKTTVAAFKTWQLTVSRHRAIADLSPDQLRDIGHAEAPAAVLEVKPGLITYLMSMR
ncbi:hypothetical protein [Rhizobium leguminosarum]|nr:hypothetical protein [Rhizobium leguminosarum]